jgi:hypothetical protein
MPIDDEARVQYSRKVGHWIAEHRYQIRSGYGKKQWKELSR